MHRKLRSHNSSSRVLVNNKSNNNKLPSRKEPKMLYEKASAYNHHHHDTIIVIDDDDEEEDDENTSSNFKLKLSSSSSPSSSTHSSVATTSTASRMSTRQSKRINNNRLVTQLSNATVDDDVIIEHCISSNNNNNNNNSLTATPSKLDESLNPKKCQWHRCDYETMMESEFLDHIQSKHIFSQKICKKFRCLWRGCRVYKSASSSFNWLERHVITHVDTKPFTCIIDDCKRKFPTQASLERHVNTHMKMYESKQHKTTLTTTLNQQISVGGSSTLSSDSSSNLKNVAYYMSNGGGGSTNHTTRVALNGRKKSKINKYLKKAKYKDYMDEFSCKYIENQLVNMNFNNGIIKLRANIVAQNTDTRSYLVEWLPKNIVKNEWVDENDFTDAKEFNVTKLTRSNFSNDENQLYRRLRFRQNKRK